jgi:hypothetical protein
MLMKSDLVVDAGGVGVAEGVTIFAMAEEENGRKRKASAKAGSLRQAQGRLSPSSRSVRNDKVEAINEMAESAWAAEAKARAKLSPKELGEIAEAEFLNTVLRKGIAVAKPWGESRGYDFILDDEGELHRVQVKAAFHDGKERGYSLRAYRSSKECYTAKDIDVLAGYVDREKVWYLFPVRVIRKLRSLKLFPGSKKKRSKHEKWREAWWIVKK